MALVMDRAELMDYLAEVFPQVKDDFAVDHLAEDRLVLAPARRSAREDEEIRLGSDDSGLQQYDAIDLGRDLIQVMGNDQNIAAVQGELSQPLEIVKTGSSSFEKYPQWTVSELNLMSASTSSDCRPEATAVAPTSAKL